MLGGLLLALGVANAAIVGKERLLARGTPMLLALAPVDPRSLVQGDYMRLEYEISRAVDSAAAAPRDGRVVVRLDARGVARLVRRHREGAPLAPGERLLRYRRRGGRARVGTDAFFFEEGSAHRYARARYGELRVDERGESVLVALRDEALRRLR